MTTDESFEVLWFTDGAWMILDVKNNRSVTFPTRAALDAVLTAIKKLDHATQAKAA